MSLGEVGGSRASRGRFTHSGEERPAWPHVPNGRACYSSAPHCRYEQVSSHSHRDEGSAPNCSVDLPDGAPHPNHLGRGARERMELEHSLGWLDQQVKALGEREKSAQPLSG